MPTKIATRAISDVQPFLNYYDADNEQSNRIRQALKMVEEDIRSGGSVPGQILGLAILRFNLADERPIFVVEMPEFTDVRADVGEYNTDWEEELRGALRK